MDTSKSLWDRIQETVAYVRSRLPGFQPRLGIILGSGLGALADGLENARAIPFAELPHFPAITVSGHPGRLVAGTLHGMPLIALQGRAHLYEGHSPEVVGYPARVLCALGVESLLVTNAAGGVNAKLHAGELMTLTDHINLSGQTPLWGPNDSRLGVRFPDLTQAYDLKLRQLLQAAAANVKVPLSEGVYLQLSGPAYETPAEIRMLRTLGADAVGMSTLPEVLVARHQNVRVAGVSCITNVAAGLSAQTLSHEEVTRVAARAADAFRTLVTEYVRLLSSGSDA